MLVGGDVDSPLLVLLCSVSAYDMTLIANETKGNIPPTGIAPVGGYDLDRFENAYYLRALPISVNTVLTFVPTV